MQVSTLANFGGYLGARDSQGLPLPLTSDGYTQWLAEYDIIFTREEQRLWPPTSTELSHLVRNRKESESLPAHQRSKHQMIQWLIQHPDTHIRSDEPRQLASEETGPQNVLDALIFWKPTRSNRELETITRDRQREMAAQEG